MRVHANAKLGPARRRRLVLLIERGMSLRAAAAASGVSVCTAIGGGIAGWTPRPSNASAGGGCMTVPAARIISRD